MDPYQNERDQLNNMKEIKESPTVPTNNSSPENISRNAPNRQQQPQYLNGFTMITPNESRRNNLRMMAQKEEENFQRLREAQRSVPVHTSPEKLGGAGTLAEAREKQMTELRYSKLQKKLKKEEEEKRRKEQEMEELQKMKDIQRQKAELLEQRRRQDEERRRDQFQSHHLSVNDRFLQQYESVASSSRSVTSMVKQEVHNTNDVPKVKRNPEELQQEHKRVNAVFLDKLESQSRAANLDHVSSPSSSPLFETPVEQQSSSHFQDPSSGHTAGDDFEWALMKLMSNFPNCEKDCLEDILSQCNSNYQQAFELLSL